ncbi:MAG: hypothetical protein VX000_11690 [Myxococcota bacterium]|nr:hypothetical protein [Myxococcota bacterium]
MTQRRPPEDPWSEVLEQVEDALRDAGVGEDDGRAALLDGVRSALDGLVGLDTRDGGSPDVVVVEGGRGEDDPPTRGEAPPLRVADAPAPNATASGDHGDAAPERPESGPPEPDGCWSDAWEESDASWPGATRVVVRAPPAGHGGPFPSLARQGRVRVQSGDNPHTIYVGPVPHPYRVACAEGMLRVAIDGSLEIELAAGCSVDVEGRQITVTADREADASGRYVRLDGERS